MRCRSRYRSTRFVTHHRLLRQQHTTDLRYHAGGSRQSLRLPSTECPLHFLKPAPHTTHHTPHTTHTHTPHTTHHTHTPHTTHTHTHHTPHATHHTPHTTRNTEHGTRNTEHGTRNTEHGNTEHGTRNTEHGTRNTEHGTSVNVTHCWSFAPQTTTPYPSSTLPIRLRTVPLPSRISNSRACRYAGQHSGQHLQKKSPSSQPLLQPERWLNCDNISREVPRVAQVS